MKFNMGIQFSKNNKISLFQHFICGLWSIRHLQIYISTFFLETLEEKKGVHFIYLDLFFPLTVYDLHKIK